MKTGLAIFNLAFVVTLIAAVSGWDYGWDIIIGIMVTTFLIQEQYTLYRLEDEINKEDAEKMTLYHLCIAQKKKLLKSGILFLMLIPVAVLAIFLLTPPDGIASAVIVLLFKFSTSEFADYLAFGQGISFLENQIRKDYNKELKKI